MITLHVCVGCGHTLFPARLLCHRCGSAAWRALPCGRGTVEAVTIVPQTDPVHLALVRTPPGVPVVVRLEHPAPVGASVVLDETHDGAVRARSSEGARA